MTTIWLTGLPSVGKTSLANALAHRLRGTCDTQILDGDVLRRDFIPELGFTEWDRRENI